jgi:hypothetical protein
MFVMTREPAPCHDPVAEAEALLARFRDRRMEELKRLREIGVQNAELLGRRAKENPCAKELLGRNGLAAEYSRVGRAVRQIVVLEMEIAGLREAPDRDLQPAEEDAAKNERPDNEREAGERQNGERSPRGDADALLRDDINDYDRGPLDQVVARIRKILRVEPPLDDPFVPSKPRDPVGSAPARATPQKPAPLNPAPQTPAARPAARPVVEPAAKTVRRPAPVAKAPPAQPVKAKKHRKRKEPRRPDARMVRAWLREQQLAQARPPPPEE